VLVVIPGHLSVLVPGSWFLGQDIWGGSWPRCLGFPTSARFPGAFRILWCCHSCSLAKLATAAGFPGRGGGGGSGSAGEEDVGEEERAADSGQ